MAEYNTPDQGNNKFLPSIDMEFKQRMHRVNVLINKAVSVATVATDTALFTRTLTRCETFDVTSKVSTLVSELKSGLAGLEVENPEYGSEVEDFNERIKEAMKKLDFYTSRQRNNSMKCGKKTDLFSKILALLLFSKTSKTNFEKNFKNNTICDWVCLQTSCFYQTRTMPRCNADTLYVYSYGFFL